METIKPNPCPSLSRIVDGLNEANDNVIRFKYQHRNITKPILFTFKLCFKIELNNNQYFLQTEVRIRSPYRLPT